MSQVRTALCTNTFNAEHAMASIHLLGHGMFICSLVKRGPTTPCIKFGIGIEQHSIAADAFVLAWFPMGFVFASVGALSRGFARHFKRQGFGIPSAKPSAPFVVGLRQVVVRHSEIHSN
jgi:hypothetical protein